MNKLFNFAQAKSKWHKLPSFNLGGGAKLYKNFAQKLLAVSLCMAVVLLGTPVTTFADPHAHTTEYSGTKGDDDYCLVCDVATKVNNLYRDSVDEITVENAAKVISQIHAIDQIKFELEDEQYEELIALTDGWSEGEYGELPSKYFKAKEKINELGRTGGWLYSTKKVLGVGGDCALDLSEAKVSLEVTPVDAADDGTYVAKSDAETMNLDMYGMYDNFSMVLNETTTDFRGQRSFYKRYDVNAGVIANVNNNGWTTSFLLPAGTYRIREVNREAPMIVDGAEFHTGSTTYTYNGASSTSVVGEDDPGVVVQVTAGGVTPLSITNTTTDPFTVSCEVDSPLESDKERDFTFTVTLDGYIINGTYGDMAFTNGVATFTLKDGESKAATGFAAGIKYAVKAHAADGFTVDSKGNTGTVEPSGQHEANFTFTRETGDLEVTVKFESPLSQLPRFSEGKVTVTADDFPNLSGTFGALNFDHGSAAFDYPGTGDFLRSATDLPVGTYTVTAVGFAEDGLSVDTTYSESGGKVVVESDDPAKVVVTNKISAASPVEKCFSKLPSALSDLTFNDTSQQLISAGTLKAAFSGCHVEYAVVETCPAEDSPFWSDSLPMRAGAGTYKVWYRVVDSSSKKVLGVSAAHISVKINQKSITDAKITIDPSSMVYTGKEFKPNVTVTLTGFGDLTKDTDYTVAYTDNTSAGDATVTITGKGNFTDSANTTFTITKAAPNPKNLHENPTLTATYGKTLGDIKAGLASAIGSFLGVDDQELEGVWAWEEVDATTVGNVGTNTFTALFKPKDTSNYDWAMATLGVWDAAKGMLAVDVAVNVSVDTSKWGTAEARVADEKTQFVDSSGKTSVEISEENLSANDVLWLREESYDTSAWYGIDLSTGAFALDKGLRFYVRWLNPDDADYAEIYAQLDDAQKARVEDDNGWIFLIGIEDPDGNKVQPAQPVSVYVQIGDDWDVDDLNAYYITSGGDENVPVDYLMLDYPEGADTFGIMTLSHFSPYFIFDELTDEEKAALELKPEDGNNQPTDKPDSSGTDSPGTGDISTELLFSGLAIVLISFLGVMLRLITSKKKFEK